MASTVNLLPAACTPVPEQEPGDDLVTPTTPYEAVLQAGFRGLRFPGQLEAEFQRDEAAQRAQLLRVGLGLATFLTFGLMMADWMMVPDVFREAVLARLLLTVLFTLFLLTMFRHIAIHVTEWFVVLGSSVSGAIVVWLCLISRDELAPAYVVSMAMIVLFNGGVTRMRFWRAVVADAVLMMLFAYFAWRMMPTHMVLMMAIALVLVSTAAFGLAGCYGLEHEERTNWLMLRHEQRLLAEIEHGNQRLEALSRHDVLTGLANRRHVDEFLQQVWDRARHEGGTVSVLMMDIDHFKAFNDHHGHPEGDACLHKVAQAMVAHLRRPGDLVGRFGGEEFIVVLGGVSLDTAVAAAERVREGVRQMGHAHGASPTADVVTVSIGAACVRPAPQEPGPGRLLALADQALYQAKQAGRDRVAALSDHACDQACEQGCRDSSGHPSGLALGRG